MQSPNPSYNHAPPNAPSPFHCPTLTKLRRVFHYRTQNKIQDPWSNPCPELIETTPKIYTEVVHWKPVFMILSKNKVGYNFIETLNRTLNSLIENKENTFAMHAAMIFPHLLLCKTKSEIDESFSKTIAMARRRPGWTI